MIDKPGFYEDIIEPDYHRDPVATPSLSNSVCKALIEDSPRHARHEHPKLNPAWQPDEKDIKKPLIVGQAFHKEILGAGRDIVEIPFDDFRKDAAKKLRDDALAVGKIPMLSDWRSAVDEMVVAFKDQIAGTKYAPLIFAPGRSEVTMVWQEGPTWCRGRIDRLPDSVMEGGHVTLADVKTTTTSARPEEWAKHAINMGYDYQASFYPRGLKALIPGILSVDFQFIVIEQQAPYGVSVNHMGGQASTEADESIAAALKLWAACMKRGEWPGYELGSAIDPAFWISQRKELRRLGMLRMVEQWQRPLNMTGEAA